MIEQARRKLMLYDALDNPVRLKAFFVIRNNPGITFNGVAKAVKAKRALVAYHLGILKVGGLVSFRYERNGKATSSYNLTDQGKEVAKELAESPNRRSSLRPDSVSSDVHDADQVSAAGGSHPRAALGKT